MVNQLKVLMTNPLLNVPLGPSEIVVGNKYLDYRQLTRLAVDRVKP